MMILRSCIALFALVASVFAACDCPKDQTNIPVYSPTNARDPVTYTSCYPDGGECTYFANSNNESVSIGGIQFNAFFSPSDNTTMSVSIFDGNVTTPFITIYPGNQLDPDISNKLNNFVSSGPIVKVRFSFTDGTKQVSDGQVSFFMYPKPRPAPPPSTMSTTPGPTFPTVSGANQPGLVGADIAFAFGSAGNDSATFDLMRSVISTTVSYLDVVTDYNSTTGVRLGFLAPSMTDKPNTFGDQWQIDATLFNTYLQAAPMLNQIEKSKWVPALAAFLQGGYFDTKYEHRPRNFTQRIFAWFIYTDPYEDYTVLKPYLLQLQTYDVHMVVVDMRKSPSKNLTDIVNSKEIPNLSYWIYDGEISSFLYEFILSSDADPTFGCNQDQNTPYPLTATPQSFSWPILYGRTIDNNGAGARYCNNQYSTLRISSDQKETGAICVVIDAYELETEKDYLRFYDVDSNEVASFTGMDIVQSKFGIPGNKTTIRFETNENRVYKGISFTLNAVDKLDACY